MKKFLFTLIIASFFGAIYGQTTNDTPDTTKTKQVELAEMVVNSSRNASRLHKTPTSVTLVKETQINQNNIQSLENINLITPNFFMINYGSKLTSPIYIRGIGSKKESPAVGLYVDGVPFLETASMNFDFFDVVKIEVLRGPQGTLFGRNTMGGLINIKTLSPLYYQGTRIRFSYSQLGTYNATVGYYNKTNNNKFAYSVSANYRYNKGIFKNIYTNEIPDKLKSYGFRNRLAYKVNNRLQIENVASFENSREYGYPYYSQKTNEISYNGPTGYDRLMFNDGLNLEYNHSKFVLETTISYQTIRDNQKIDQDFTSQDIYFANLGSKQNTISTEVTIHSKPQKTYNWMFGTFALSQNKNFSLDIAVNIPKRQTTVQRDFRAMVISGGFFHQSELKLFDNILLTAGIRYNYENSALRCQEIINVNGKKIEQDTVFPNLEEHVLLPKLSVSYTFANSLVYLQYATGYKPGGFNIVVNRVEDSEFKKQIAHNYEIGYKQTLLDRRLYADVALFWSDITGQQIVHFIQSGQGTYLDNSRKSRNKGIEVSLNLADLKGFDLNIGYGYTQAKILEYQKDTLNYSGKTVPFVPAHTFSATVAKTFKLGDQKFLQSIRLQANYKQMGHIYWRIENDLEQNTYGLLNASLSFTTKLVNFDLWVQNMTNQKYNVFMLHLSQFNHTFYQKGLPRMIGATISINF